MLNEISEENCLADRVCNSNNSFGFVDLFVTQFRTNRITNGRCDDVTVSDLWSDCVRVIDTITDLDSCSLKRNYN